ncbi:MAG: phosphate acyltransferase PlsX [Chitinophagaceae bacterium]|jgi:glycerol-3-phosphate acyltransferase PlsX|nr:phosphate acyltransferase PlsX [Chitinophagaceae bacterium]
MLVSGTAIGIDMMGGDYAPHEAVKGLQFYLSGNAEKDTIFCIGKKEELNTLFKEYNLLDNARVCIIDAPEIIGYNEHPTKALKEKTQSSIAIGFHLLATGKIDAFISAGNTGAMLVGAMYSIKAIKGVLRPTIPTIVPKLNGQTGLLLDVGLNADCKPEHLNQFAVLAGLYADLMLNINTPRVGLLNIGEEDGKGNLLAQAAYPLLKENKLINFIGNIEGRDIFKNKADVIVCDGFTGNIVLKMAESIYDIALHQQLQNDAFLKRFHYENYGGTPVLGVAKPVVIGHGISNAKAFGNMIVQARKMLETNLCEKIKNAFVTGAGV